MSSINQRRNYFRYKLIKNVHAESLVGSVADDIITEKERELLFQLSKHIYEAKALQIQLLREFYVESSKIPNCTLKRKQKPQVSYDLI